MERLYLRPNVQVEPLVDQWYAWSHLIPPATAARNLVERHIKIMRSYIAAPQIHSAAVCDPKLLGGPFMDYPINRVQDVIELLDRTISGRAPLLMLSKALQELNVLLETKAKGESLQSLYSLVPECLKGYVELAYDLNNYPSFRLIEALVYKSEFYDSNAQSIALSEINGDNRPFILSTARLPVPGLFRLSLPFRHEAIDALFRAKRLPANFNELAEQCQVAPTELNQFKRFFTEQPPLEYEPYRGSGARWRYFGHACILLETKDISILFDPVLSYTYETVISRYTYDDIPDYIDYVVITHNHQDHVLLETMLQLRHKIGCVIVPQGSGGFLQDPSLRLTLEQIGFPNVVELDEMQKISFEGGFIQGLPFFGEHADLSIRTKLAYLVDLAGTKLMFAADSCNIEPALYKHLNAHIGDIRALFVGMECDGAPLSWLYGPLITRQLKRSDDQSRRLSGCNFAQALDIVNALKCKEVFVYAMGQEPWLNYVMSLKYSPDSNPIVQSNSLLEACRAKGLIAERLFGEREMLLN